MSILMMLVFTVISRVASKLSTMGQAGFAISDIHKRSVGLYLSVFMKSLTLAILDGIVTMLIYPSG